MGEWSKTVGEFGETIVERFLALIGWTDVQQKISVECVKQKAHATEEGKTRQTHGIDFYRSYLSPLIDSTRKNVHVSSKYTGDPYPNAPSRTFKEHVEDLVYAIECFRYSDKKKALYSNLKGYKHTEDVGVLFWLSDDQKSYDDLISKVANAQVQLGGGIHSLFVVDNKRLSFIYLSMKHAKANYKDAKIDFYYPSTGKNINPLEKQDFGPALPVEFINSNILPLRIQRSNGQTGLVLFSSDSFSPEDLRRLIGLSQDLSKSWSGFVEISFRDFSPLRNSEEVRQVLSDFASSRLSEIVTVTSYSDVFTNLNQ